MGGAPAEASRCRDRHALMVFGRMPCRPRLLKDSDKRCWPWNKKKGWKGPLPQPRLSPPRSLGDFLVPKITEAVVRRSQSQGFVLGQDPLSQPIQISNNELVGPSDGLASEVGHNSSWSRRNPGLYFLCRRLAPRSFVRRNRSYAQAVMAGGSATATGAGGVGGG